MTNRSERRQQEKKLRKAQRKVDNEEIVFEFSFDPNFIQAVGPIINTFVQVSQTHAQELAAQGKSIPEAVKCRFLIDTGSSITVVRHDIADKAGLKLINSQHSISGIGVDASGKIYMGQILFRIASKVSEGTMHDVYVNTKVFSGNLTTPHFDGIIGRDVLRHFHLTYLGPSGDLRMRFIRPPSQQT